jgi:hypothetical protein
MSTENSDALLLQELESRIEALENEDEVAFGSFTLADYIILIVAGVLLPILALVLAA